MDVTIIIPTWNLKSRGYNRLDHVLWSLKCQSVTPSNIIVSDGSDKDGAHRIQKITAEFPDVQYMHIPQPVMMNMPALYNRAASSTDTKYLFFTGADFVYGSDFIKDIEPKASPGKIVFVSTVMGGQQGIFSRKSISSWKGTWDRRSENVDRMKPHKAWGGWGEHAPGKQIYSRELFEATQGFDEKFVGISAFDTDMAFRIATVYGKMVRPIKKQWTHTKDCWHIWHKPDKLYGAMGATRRKNHIRQQAIKIDWDTNQADYIAKGIKIYNWKFRTI